ncbi:uncharacterized protein LOC118738086 [Rhagoletis pomonella]|uniref:uncharacterized protein LOC118738086 n=1 Tax=Rhagoletis pomonella TaxID=28610 RepID=UPI0017860529|nr:uncharacterized protein LOC118738086 [Rhagoletis pomonella]
MGFDINACNNIPQSSTSSCMDCFSNGCYSKIHNFYHINFQNCQCHPCCVSSMINDHTYSLLKKICRKVIKDYQRKESRERYTIFDGGNSINVRIHRSSIGEDGLNQNEIKRISHRNGKGRNKSPEYYDETDKGKGKYRKSYSNDFGDEGIKLSKRKNAKKEKNGNEDDKPKRSQAKGKVEENRDDNDNKNRGRKGRHMKEDERSKIEGHVSEKQDKRIAGERKEGEIGKRVQGKIGMSHGADGENPYVEASQAKDKGKKPEGASKERSYDKSGIEKGKKLDEIGDYDKSKLYSKSGKKTPEKPGKSDKIKTNNEEHEELETGTQTKRGNVLKKGSPEDGTSNVNDNVKSVVGAKPGSRKMDANGKADRKDQTQIERNSRFKDNHVIGGNDGKGSHKGRRGLDSQADATTTTKNASSKKGLPVITNLRAKVRKGYDIMPSGKKSMGKETNRSSEYQEFGIKARLGQRTTNKTRKQRLSKSSKDHINERYGSKRNRMSRSSRSFGGYRTRLPSRYDEIRICDVLRAHMEQRELCRSPLCRSLRGLGLTMNYCLKPTPNFNLNLSLSSNIDFKLNLGLNINLSLNHNRNRNLNFNIYLSLKLSVNLNLYLTLNLNPNHNFNLNIYLRLNLDHNLNSAPTPPPSSPFFCPLFMPL